MTRILKTYLKWYYFHRELRGTNYVWKNWDFTLGSHTESSGLIVWRPCFEYLMRSFRDIPFNRDLSSAVFLLTSCFLLHRGNTQNDDLFDELNRISMTSRKCHVFRSDNWALFMVLRLLIHNREVLRGEDICLVSFLIPICKFYSYQSNFFKVPEIT